MHVYNLPVEEDLKIKVLLVLPPEYFDKKTIYCRDLKDNLLPTFQRRFISYVCGYDTDYKKALDVWPDFAEAQINLGVIYFHLGDFAEARRCFMLLDRNHENARVSVYLQFIENRLGKSI